MGVKIHYKTKGPLSLQYRAKPDGKTVIQIFLYADDATLCAKSRNELQHMLDVLNTTMLQWGLTIVYGWREREIERERVAEKKK